MPLCGNGPIFELSAARRRVPPDRTRDRAGQSTQLARDGPHTGVPSAFEGYLLAFNERQVAVRRHRRRGKRCVGDIPAELPNRRVPTGAETPAATSASSLESPAAISCQNRHRCSRCQTGGRLGEDNLSRVERSDFRLPVVISTSKIRVSRRPVDSALRSAVGMVNQPRCRVASHQSTAQSLDCEVALQTVTRGPAGDATGEEVED